VAGLGLSVRDERDAAAVCQLLSQVDGATILGPRGELLETGVHLRYSARAGSLIPETGGTRHTSARRFSYDHHDTLVVTVSEDGPVTVFSDGASIADLRARTAAEEAQLLKALAPGKGAGIGTREFELVCARCGKTSVLGEVRVLGCERMQRSECPTCRQPLYTARCFSLSCRPLKKTTGRIPEASDRESCG
jgi:hypothetical protein